MDWMKPLQFASDVLQKPQSIATGVLSEVTGSADNARRFIDQYERAIVDDTPENATKYKAALALVGNSRDSAAGPGGITNLSSLVGGAVRGAKGNVRPSDITTAATGEEHAVLDPAANLLIDPMLAVGSGGGSVKLLEGTQAGKLINAAGTIGKLAPEAGKAEHAAQLARRLYQGALISGGDPLLAIGAATGIGTAERAGSALLGRLGGQVAEDLVGQGTENALSRTGAEQLDDAYELAVQKLGRDLPEAQSLNSTVGAQGEGFQIPGMADQFPRAPSQAMELLQTPTRTAPAQVMEGLQNRPMPSPMAELNAGPPVDLPFGEGPAMPMGRVPMGQAVERVSSPFEGIGRAPGANIGANPQAGVGAFPEPPAQLLSGPPVHAMGSPQTGVTGQAVGPALGGAVDDVDSLVEQAAAFIQQGGRLSPMVAKKKFGINAQEAIALMDLLKKEGLLNRAKQTASVGAGGAVESPMDAFLRLAGG